MGLLSHLHLLLHRKFSLPFDPGKELPTKIAELPGSTGNRSIASREKLLLNMQIVCRQYWVVAMKDEQRDLAMQERPAPMVQVAHKTWLLSSIDDRIPRLQYYLLTFRSGRLREFGANCV